MEENEESARKHRRIMREGVISSCAAARCITPRGFLPDVGCIHPGCMAVWHKKCIKGNYCPKHKHPCTICKGRGGGPMVRCVQCRDSYHIKCVGANKITNAASWTCVNCAICSVCNVRDSCKGMVMCGNLACTRFAHAYVCTKGEDPWYCALHDFACECCKSHKYPELMMQCEACLVMMHAFCDGLDALPPKSEPWFCKDHRLFTGADYDDWNFCKVCNNRNGRERMAHCLTCGNRWHIECLNPPLSEVPERWFCADHDQKCEKCWSRYNSCNMICCAGCGKFWHRKCTGLGEAGPSTWRCSDCRA